MELPVQSGCKITLTPPDVYISSKTGETSISENDQLNEPSGQIVTSSQNITFQSLPPG